MAENDRLDVPAPTIGPDDPLRVRVDPDGVVLALRNLIDNALKYSPESSTVKVSIDGEDGFAKISVRDHGVGLPKQERRQIFRKFARGASAQALNVKGTGIGLTMADEIVRAHQGRIDVESEPGRWSTFTIVLPLQLQAPRSAVGAGS